MENAFDRTTARIAVWNLAGFGGIEPERRAKQLDGLCYLDAEVVVLIEISPYAYLEELVAQLVAKGCEYESISIRQRNNLHIGVLFKRGVMAENPRFVPGSDLEDNRRRQALVVDMRIGRFDFTLIAVHLHAGRGGSDQKIRDEQCKVIGDFIKDLRDTHGREDVLLLGDYNMIPGQDVSNFHFLGGDDCINFLSSWDLQERFSHILPRGRANLIDGFAISRTFSTEYVRGSLQLFPMHWTMDMGRESFREEVSDHLPFVATFRIDRDRD